MMAINPKILELTEQTFPLIGSFLKDKGLVSMNQIAQFLKKRKIDGFTFRGIAPFSYQLEYIITNLIRRGLLDEHGSLLQLTAYGEKRLGLQKK